jgi:hypothetical protein
MKKNLNTRVHVKDFTREADRMCCKSMETGMNFVKMAPADGLSLYGSI